MLSLKLAVSFFLLAISISLQYFLCDAVSIAVWHLHIVTFKDGTNDSVEITLIGDKGNGTHNIYGGYGILPKEDFHFSTQDIGSMKNISITVLGNDSWAIEKITLTNIKTHEVGFIQRHAYPALKLNLKFYITKISTSIPSTTTPTTMLMSTSPIPTSVPTTITTTDDDATTADATTTPTDTTNVDNFKYSNIQTMTTADVATSAPTTVATCYSGWINVKDLCYKIANTKTERQEAEDSCEDDSILAIKIPKELRDNIGYNETVWINNSGDLQACDLNNVSQCTTSGSYHPLCSRTLINAAITLSGRVKFFHGSWMIPNTWKSLQIIKQHFSSCCTQKGMWIGLYASSGKFYWSDNSSVSGNEAELLNISISLLTRIFPGGFSRKCAAYIGYIEFTSCSSRKMGLTTPFPEPTATSMCPCSCVPLRQNISAEEFQESLKEIVINKKDTSKYKRAKTSAADERTSSKAIGMVAIIFIVVPFGVLILSDVPTLFSQLKKTYKRIENRTK